MSADRAAETNAPEPRITIDDVKRRAEAVRDLATSEAKRAADELLREKVTQTVLAGVVIVAVLTSIAFVVGTRKGRSACRPALPPGWPPQ